MSRIKLQNKKIKLENNKSILVDESAGEIGSFRLEYMSNIGNPYTRIYDSMNGNTIMEIDKIDKGRIGFTYEIIATINHSISLDVPMVIIKDEVEKLADEYLKSFIDAHGTEDVDFIAGYKAAQQKGSYSEEDLIDLVQQLKDYTKEGLTILGNDDREAEEFVDIFTSSLKQEYIELEMEEVFHKGTQEKQDDGSIIFKKAEIPVTLEIKTNRVKGQLMAYLKT
jgi:hypothetical protein